MRARVTATQFDLREIGRLSDPYPRYAQARETGRVLSGGPGQWVITWHQDVAALLRDARLSHEFAEEYYRMAIGAGPANEFVRRVILNRDPPAHTTLRRAMGRILNPGVFARLAGRIRTMAAELLEPALERGRLDVVEEVASPLPVLVACELIGIPAADRPFVRHWAGELTKAFGVRPDERDRADANTAVTTLRDYAASMLAGRAVRSTRGDEDLASLLLAVHRENPELGIDDVVDNVVFLLFAGFETTVNLISTGADLLLEHQAEQARLRADPSLIATAVEEFLRFDGPITSTSRLVREEVTVDGRALRPGRVVHLLLGSANRDPAVFPDPDRLDVGRAPNPHLSFSGGPHYCLGAALARLESGIVFERILDACATFTREGPSARRLDPSFRMLTSVPARVRPA